MPETIAVPPFTARIVERLSVGATSRRERVIHSLDGLENPVHPDTLATTGADLWRLLQEQVPDGLGSVDFLLGLDAGGILPTVSLDGAVRFSEPHAMRTDVFAYGVFAYGITHGQRIIIVDDKITTGRTLADLTRRLREAGAVPLAAACLVEDTTRGARDLLTDLGVPLVSLTTIEGAE